MAQSLLRHLKFWIHSYFLERDSIFFKNLLASPATGTDSSYVIQGLKCNEFESLLGFFYDRMYNLSPTAVPLQTWINILSVSTQFKLQKSREHAIATMDAHFAASQLSPPMSPVEMLVIAEKHGIERWATLPYRQLCEREEHISQSEAEKIGLTSTVKVARDREQCLKAR
uniref:BTB domain-containing protein n=1 Tax=Moniliophthora roreri TaxID=221103 RepID=A0A0W0FBA6_MONRR